MNDIRGETGAAIAGEIPREEGKGRSMNEYGPHETRRNKTGSSLRMLGRRLPSVREAGTGHCET